MCETSCHQSTVQCENSSDWVLPQIAVQFENSRSDDFVNRAVWTRHNFQSIEISGVWNEVKSCELFIL